MPYYPEQLPAFTRTMSEVIQKGDLQRSDWRRQTDAVQLTAIAAQMHAEAPEHVIFVDGRIADTVVAAAISSGDTKRHINRLCHDKGLTCRRLIVLDTKATKRMAAGERLRPGKANLHFHAIFLLEEGQKRPWLAARLRDVFGVAAELGPRQFRYGAPDPTQHKTFSERQGHGIVGKLCYMLDHAGSTYATLGLNEAGRRSRRAPAYRRRCNEQAQGLAQGLPRNFLSGVVLCDNTSKREARKAFEAWIAFDASSVRGRVMVDPTATISCASMKELRAEPSRVPPSDLAVLEDHLWSPPSADAAPQG